MISRAHIAAILAQVAPPSGIQYVGGASTSATTSGTLTLSLSGTLTGGVASSPAAGDIVIAAALATGTSDRALRHSGDGTWADYTELGELYADDARDTNLSVSRKTMGASPDTQIQADSFHSTGAYGGILAVTVWRGVNATAIASQTSTLTNSALADAPSVTPTVAGSVALAVCGAAHVENKIAEPSLSGFTARVVRVQNATSCSAKLLMASQSWSGSGAIDPPAWTDSDTDSANASAAAFTVLLEPSA